jgi:hypothetical protein
MDKIIDVVCLLEFMKIKQNKPAYSHKMQVYRVSNVGAVTITLKHNNVGQNNPCSLFFTVHENKTDQASLLSQDASIDGQ